MTTNLLGQHRIVYIFFQAIFLGEDFISVNKADTIKWDDIKHIVISLINDFYADGNEFVIDENAEEQKVDFDEITICFMSSHLIASALFTEIKSSPKKIPSTPLTDSIFLTKSFWIPSFFVISQGPLFETFLPGKNFKEFGFGVTSV